MKSTTKKTFTISENQLKANWRKGPIGDIFLEPGHDRPIYCMSVQDKWLVTGSADHGLRVYDINEGSYAKELFSKNYGHKEWVTAVTHLKDGRVLSGAMDSMLCLWDKVGVRCDFLKGHDGPISKVMVDEYNIGVSASYDTTLLLWDLDAKDMAVRLQGFHKEAIIDFDWHNSLLVSGDRNGYIAIWVNAYIFLNQKDVNEAKPIKTRKCHAGAVSQVVLHSDSLSQHCIVTAGVNVMQIFTLNLKDGTVCVHDMRTNDIVYSEQLHKGAVNSVKVNLSNMIVTGSADKTIKLIDLQSGFKTFGTMKTTDAVYVLETVHNLTIAGTGDGNILAYDNDTLECLYGYGVMQKGAVRCLHITPDKTKLIAAGEDTHGIVVKYA